MKLDIFILLVSFLLSKCVANTENVQFDYVKNEVQLESNSTSQFVPLTVSNPYIVELSPVPEPNSLSIPIEADYSGKFHVHVSWLASSPMAVSLQYDAESTAILLSYEFESYSLAGDYPTTLAEVRMMPVIYGVPKDFFYIIGTILVVMVAASIAIRFVDTTLGHGRTEKKKQS